LIAKGWTTPRIAAELNISTGTAVSHRRELMRKLKLHNTAEVTAFAIRHGLGGG
jgi:two-component system NarL family response regulator